MTKITFHNNSKNIDFVNSREFYFIKLLKDINNNLHKQFRQQLKTQTITPSQLSIILELRKFELCSKNKNDEVTQITLADALFIEPISVARTLDKMQQMNLIFRTPHPRDKRANIIKLNHDSPLIKDVLSNASQIGFGISSKLLSALTTKEQDDMIKIFEKLSNFISNI